MTWHLPQRSVWEVSCFGAWLGKGGLHMTASGLDAVVLGAAASTSGGGGGSEDAIVDGPPPSAPAGGEGQQAAQVQLARPVVASEAAATGSGRALNLLVVFGASGGTGLCVVQQALEQGYGVRAFVRSRHSFELELGDLASNTQLEVVEGDLLDPPAVEAAILGARAVISVAGAKPESAPGPMAGAIQAMVEGCRRHGVRKLIVQTCAMSPLPTERIGWFTQFNMVRTVVRWQMGSSVVEDNDSVIQYLFQHAQDLDWVVSRPPGLMDGDPIGPPVPCADEFKTAFVRYADVATWTLIQVESDAFVGQAPRLYYPPVKMPI